MVVIVIVVVVLTLVGAMYGLYTRRGSGVEQHLRAGDHVGSPGVGAGEGRMSSHADENEGAFDEHGSA